MKTPNNLSERQVLEVKYKNSRNNLLIVVAFTVVNILLLISKSDTYFLFSAYIPYALVVFGMLFSGMYPQEYYEQEFSEMQMLSPAFFAVLLGIALVIVAFYLISWIFSKNNKSGWLIFALVIFSVDTLGMLFFTGVALENIIDIVFHVWVIISLALGINAGSKLKKIPAEDAVVSEIQNTEEDLQNPMDLGVLRVADRDVKQRILLEHEVLGHVITYRRVKRVNELVIDGNVYDEIEALVEAAHSLKAKVDGHLIEVGFDGLAHSYLKIDGQKIAKKLRLY